MPAASARSSRLPVWAVVLLVLAGLFSLALMALLSFGAFQIHQFSKAQGETRRAVMARREVATRAEPANTPQAPAAGDAGLTYSNAVFANVPWSIHVVAVERSRKDLTVISAHARGQVLGVSTIAEQARAVPSSLGKAVAGINGDFYLRDNPTYGGDPRGLQIMNGDLISGPSTVCVWFDAEGNPHLDEVKGDFQVTWPDGRKTPFGLNQQRSGSQAVLFTPSYGPSTRTRGGRELVLEKSGDGPWLPLLPGENYRARVRSVRNDGDTKLGSGQMVLSLSPDLAAGLPALKEGEFLQISTATTPDLKGSKNAMAGGPALIKDGEPFRLMEPPPGTGNNYSEASKYQRHPRSAIGWSPTHIYFVTADGRQPGYSVGMKLAELAQFMAGLGCTDAMNLDGGKSAQLWLNGKIINSPSQGEDTVANSLLVIRKPATP